MILDRPLPQNWKSKRLKYVATYNDEALSEATDDEVEIDYIEISGVSLTGGIEEVNRMSFYQAPSRARRKVQAGDILVSTVRTYLKAIATVGPDASENLIASTGFCVVRPGEDMDSGYLGWVAKSEPFVGEVVARSVGVSYPAINASDLVDMGVPVPPMPVQQRIARFLDKKTARIDTLIEKKQTLLERLVEKHQALITRAVTTGLNQDVPMKPSGVDWLGDIPMHWDIVPLRRMVDLVRGHDLPQQDRVDGDVAIISSAGESGTHDTAACQGPGIVTGRYGTIGRFYFVEGPFWPLNTTLYSRALSCDPTYGLRMLEAMAHLFVLNAMKSAVPGVDRNDLASEYTPRPPRDEQRDISEYLKIGLEGLRQSQSLIASSIERLSEHRAALITAAVTGQLSELNG